MSFQNIAKLVSVRVDYASITVFMNHSSHPVVEEVSNEQKLPRSFTLVVLFGLYKSDLTYKNGR